VIDITAHGLAMAIGDYLRSQRAAEIMEEVFGAGMERLGESSSADDIEDRVGMGGGSTVGDGRGKGRRQARIRARTAQRWLKKMGFTYGEVRKCVYIDGHEWEDVMVYRRDVFLPLWDSLVPRMVKFEEDGSWAVPDTLPLGEEPVVFITHDESTFNANDGKRRIWKEEGKQPLRAKS